MALVLLLMVLANFLGHGITRGMYDQFAVNGSPPAAMGPVGEAGRNQMGHWGFFWSERAFHYRTTLMFAVDDYTSPDVLAQDTGQQFPEGVNAWRQYTLMMEPVYGQLYRWFGHEGEILVEFLTRLLPLINALLLLPLYLWTRALKVRPILGVLAVAVLATCAMTYDRFAGSLLLKENFALFWLAVFLASSSWANRRRSFLLLIMAAISLLVLLASWHLSQFLVLVVLGSMALSAGQDKIESDGKKTWPWEVVQSGVYLAACLVASLTPSLLARGFYFSLPMMAVFSWFISSLLLQQGKTKHLRVLGSRTGLVLVLFLVLGGASFLNRHFTGDYNHLFGLLWHKLVNGLARPADPDSLPFDVRVFWVAPFNTPSWATVWAKLGYHLIYLLPSAVAATIMSFKAGIPRYQRGVLLMATAFLFGFVLIERLGVVYLPFAVAALAVQLEYALRNQEQKKGWSIGSSRQGTILVGLLLVLTTVGNLLGRMEGQWKTATSVAQGHPVYIKASDQDYWGFRGDLLRWIVANTPGPNSRFGYSEPLAVAGDIGISTQVLLYSGRPIVLNSQFENQPIRRRYQQYLEALYSTEAQDLADFLSQTQAGYLFINRNLALTDTPGSAAYMAGHQGPLQVDMNIARLHFSPETLGFLQPVYNNEFFRLFKVVEPGPVQSGSAATWERNFGNWWNLERFTVDEGQLTEPLKDQLALLKFEKNLVDLQDAQAQIMRAQGAGHPPLPALHQRYMELKLEYLLARSKGQDTTAILGQVKNTVANIQGVLRSQNPIAKASLGQGLAALFTRGPGPDQPGWRQLLESSYMEPTHLAAAGQLAAMLGQYEQAADLMTAAAGSFPLLPTVAGDGRPGLAAAPLATQIRQFAVWYCLAADRIDQARELAGAFARFSNPDSPVGQFFRKVAAISDP